MLEALDHLLHFVGGQLCAPGQGAYLIRNHGKATPHLPCPRSFNGGIERQQVGLFGNTADHRQHFIDRGDFLGQLGDRLRRFADIARHAFNTLDRMPHHLTRLQGFVARRLRGLCSIAGVAGNVLHGQAHFVYGGGDHFGHFLLATGAFGGVVHNPGHLLHRPVQALGCAQHLADQAALAVEKTVEPARQVTQFVLARIIQAMAEVACTAANLYQRGSDTADRPHQPTCQQHHQQQ